MSASCSWRSSDRQGVRRGPDAGWRRGSARLGVRLDAEQGAPFRGIRFLDDRHVAEATFPGEAGVGIRRTRLHQLLMENAQAAGVTTLWREKATAIESKGVRIGDRLIECRWIIGADGVDSQTRRLAGMGAIRENGRRIGLRMHFRVKPWTDFVEVHWSKGEQAYVTPVGAEEVCIALLGCAREVGFANLADRFPRLGERLRGAEPANVARGAFTGTVRLRRVVSGNVALIGDASAAIDAITGDGLALAFRQAAALGEALRQGDLSRYEARHRQICRTPFLMARLLLLMDRHDALRKLALQALAGAPRFSTACSRPMSAQGIPPPPPSTWWRWEWACWPTPRRRARGARRHDLARDAPCLS